MRPILIAGTLVLGLAWLAACADRTALTAVSDRPLFANAPSDGNGNKLVIPIDDQFPFPCAGGPTLDVHVVGFVQLRDLGQPNNPNVAVNTVNLVFTFTNTDGETFVWRETGMDRWHVENDRLLIAVIGRVGFFGVIGRLIVDAVTFEVQLATGKNVGNTFDQACAALT